jgi:hypothetical protein
MRGAPPQGTRQAAGRSAWWRGSRRPARGAAQAATVALSALLTLPPSLAAGSATLAPTRYSVRRCVSASSEGAHAGSRGNEGSGTGELMEQAEGAKEARGATRVGGLARLRAGNDLHGEWSYSKLVWSRAIEDWCAFIRGHVAASAVLVAVGTIGGVLFDLHRSGAFFSADAWVAPSIGTLFGFLVVVVGSLAWSRIMAPRRLYNESQGALQGANRTIRLLEAEESVRRQEVHKNTSDVTVFEHWNGESLFLRIDNSSDAAWFSALIERTYGTMSDWPDRMVFAKWDHQDAVKTEIPREAYRLLHVGRLERDYRTSIPIGTWLVPYTSDSGTGLARSTKSYRPEPDFQHLVPKSAVEFRVTLHADNGITGGSYVADIRFCGEEHKVIISRLPPPADPPSSKASE